MILRPFAKRSRIFSKNLYQGFISYTIEKLFKTVNIRTFRLNVVTNNNYCDDENIFLGFSNPIWVTKTYQLKKCSTKS